MVNRAVGNWAILAGLALGEATVIQLTEPFDMREPAISRHLKVMEGAGLIARRSEGVSVQSASSIRRICHLQIHAIALPESDIQLVRARVRMLCGSGMRSRELKRMQRLGEGVAGQRLLVTAGAGFIGSHLCDRLLRDEAEVLAVDNYITSRRANIAHLVSNPLFKVMRHDVTFPLDDPRQRRPNITKAKAIIDWKPMVVLEDSLKEAVANFRKLLAT